MSLTTKSLTDNTWVLVGENITTGWIGLKELNPDSQTTFYIYVATGEAAPTLAPDSATSTALPFEGQHLPVNIGYAIDVYLYTKAGTIHANVDLS